MTPTKCCMMLMTCLPIVLQLHAEMEENAGWQKRTEWFREAKYGIFTHYLSQNVTNAEDIHSDKVARDWNDCVDAFDVERFADNMKRMGAGYVVFTINQGTRYVIAPNDAFDRIFGTHPGEACARRDLIRDLIDALEKRGIPLMLYWTGDGTCRDPELVQRSGYSVPVPMEWVEKWAQAMEFYACRYGDKIKGWWLDGCYVKHGNLGYTPEKLKVYERAIRKGNPDGIVAFNNPISCDVGPIEPYMPFEDYTAGEMNNISQLPQGGDLGRQWHVLTFLGSLNDAVYAWGEPGVRYDTEALAQYIHVVNSRGGVATFDVMCYWDGGLERSQVNTFAGLRERLEHYASIKGDDDDFAFECPCRILDAAGQPLPSQVFCRNRLLGATDGNPHTYLQGCFKWSWQLEVDLGEVKTFSRVDVSYTQFNFATRYRVSVSPDGKRWITVAEEDNADWKRQSHVSFAPVQARYVRFLALKPDGENQPGYQMAISEISVRP